MTEQVDLDALIAEARSYNGVVHNPLMHRLADALEQSQAELRQERERARDAEERMRLLDQANDEEIDRTDKAEAALSRAEETIEKALERAERSSVYPLSGDIRGILKSYAAQKEQA